MDPQENVKHRIPAPSPQQRRAEAAEHLRQAIRLVGLCGVLRALGDWCLRCCSSGQPDESTYWCAARLYKIVLTLQTWGE